MKPSLLGRYECGWLRLRECSNTSRYVAKEYWYMLFTVAKSDRTKKSIAPCLAAGRYPSLNLSISLAVTAPKASFSRTWGRNKNYFIFYSQIIKD